MNENYLDLALDCDGVVKDDIPELNKLMLEKELDKTRPEHQTDINKLFGDLDWYDLLKRSEFINDSLNAIREIIKLKIFRHHVMITSTNSYKENYGKNKYFDEVGLPIPIICVPKGVSKSFVYYPYRTILVDDYKPNVSEWDEKGGIGIKFNDIPKIGESFHVITNLLEVIDIVNGIDIPHTDYETVKQIIKSKIK